VNSKNLFPGQVAVSVTLISETETNEKKKGKGKKKENEVGRGEKTVIANPTRVGCGNPVL
jgi:hypothetical protein